MSTLKKKKRNTEGDRVGPTRDNSPTYHIEQKDFFFKHKFISLWPIKISDMWQIIL